MPGTSAELQAGDIISLKDLLYALMLPSGNDASVAIAETVGKIIQKYKKEALEENLFRDLHLSYESVSQINRYRTKLSKYFRSLLQPKLFFTQSSNDSDRNRLKKSLILLNNKLQITLTRYPKLKIRASSETNLEKYK